MFISEFQYTINGQCLSQAPVELPNNVGWSGLKIVHVASKGQSTVYTKM
jgi:hypothetical protein